jgi:type VI secretion system protein ImpJ
MSVRAVHWHEGMFLRPHHFQAAVRHQTYLLHQNVAWDNHHCWGVRKLVVDPDALAAFRLVLRALEVRFRDGSIMSLPADGPEPVLELKPLFVGQSRVEVSVAVPQLRVGSANQAIDGSPGRFKVESLPIEDENTGVNPQPLGLRSLNFRLLTGDDDRAGFEVIPLLRLEKSERAEATPKIDGSYIPPVLACDAWPGLQNDILQSIYFRLNKKIEVLATQVISRGISFDSHSQGDGRRIAQLNAMNEAYALLSNLAFVPGVHPLEAYLELCRLVGKLSIFGPDIKPPDLPRYDHDDLGGCFWRLKHHLDALLNEVDEPVYHERPFIGAGLRMQVTIEPAWLESAWQMFLGVRSSIAGEECVKLLTRPERLGLKIGSSDRVDTIFTRGQEGMRFAPSPRPPRDLPSGPNLTYFEITREPPTEWQNVQKSLTLAIRMKEGDIVSNIQGSKELTIRVGSQTASFQFTLYVVPAVRPGG